MELTHLHSLLQYRHAEVLSCFKVTKSLSPTQAQLNLLVGTALRNETSTDKVKEYLSFLDIMDSLEIKGLPHDTGERILQQFIESYFKTLKEIVRNNTNDSVKELVYEKLHEFVERSAEKHLSELIKKFKSDEMIRASLVLAGLGHVEMQYRTAESIFVKSAEGYLNSPMISLKYEKPHLVAFSLFISLLKSHSRLFKKRLGLISSLFRKAQGICKKYIQKKMFKETIFLLCCEYIILCLTNNKVISKGLKNVKLPGIFTKTCYAESYLSYFFNQTYHVLKNCRTTTKLLMGTKDHLITYLKSNHEYISPALNSFYEHLKCAEDTALLSIIIRIIRDLFEISPIDVRNDIFVPYILLCFRDLDKKVSADLIGMIIKFVPKEFLKNLDSIFSLGHKSFSEENVVWIKKVVKEMEQGPQLEEICKSLVIMYQILYKDQRMSGEINNTLLAFAERFPNFLLAEVLKASCEMLLQHEKNNWVKNIKEDSEKLMVKALSLLSISHKCILNCSSPIKISKLNEFWAIVTHFQRQYKSKECISLSQNNENLCTIAKITPNILRKDHKDNEINKDSIDYRDNREIPTLFLHLFEAQQYQKVFLPELKTYLSKFCSKK